MGGKGGGGGGGTTKQVSEPWAQQKPYLQGGRNLFGTLVPGVFPEAAKLYKNGSLAPDYYKGNTVAPQSQWTQDALQMQADRAMAGDAGVTQAQNAMNSITSGNALAGNTGLNALEQLSGQNFNAGNAGLDMALGAGNAAMNNAGLSSLEQLAGQSANAGNAGLGMIQDASANMISGNAGLPLLQSQAGQDVNAGNAGLSALEQMTTAQNPYMSALYSDAAGQAGAKIDSGFSSAGRYGSGAHENARADAMTDLASQMYSHAYDQQANAAQAAGSLYNQGTAQNASNAQALSSLYGNALNSQLAAGQAYGGLWNSGLGMDSQNASNAANAYNAALQTQLGAGQAAGNLYNAGSGLQLDAAQQAGQLYNTGIGQQAVAGQTAQQLANQAYTDAAALSEAGGVLDDYQQQLINADIDRYNYDAQKALTALSNYNQLIQGSYGGTTTSMGQQQGSGSKLGGALGGAMTGAAIGSQILPGWGTAIGAIGGGLLGLF